MSTDTMSSVNGKFMQLDGVSFSKGLGTLRIYVIMSLISCHSFFTSSGRCLCDLECQCLDFLRELARSLSFFPFVCHVLIFCAFLCSEVIFSEFVEGPSFLSRCVLIYVIHVQARFCTRFVLFRCFKWFIEPSSILSASFLEH